jgi:WXXGXW repeat (2 copies)
MGKYLLAYILLSCILLSGCSVGYVAKRPPDLRYARSVSPGPGYIWTSGEWEYSRGEYHWREGSWQRAREGRTWKSGYWETSSRGYKWHKGQWQ